MAEDLRDAVDVLREDMAQHQRRFSGLPTDSKNHTLAVEAIEQFERESRDAAPVVSAPAQLPVADSVERRDLDHGSYVIDKASTPERMFRTASEFESEVIARAQPRIALLLSKRESGPLGTPSWSERTLAAMFFKVKSLEASRANRLDLAEHYERAYQLDLSELLEASNQPFGDWRRTTGDNHGKDNH